MDDALQHGPGPPLLAPDSACGRFAAAWRAGSRPRLEDYLAQTPTAHHPRLLVELLVVELEERRQAGEPVRLGDYLHRFPQYGDLLRQLIGDDTIPSARSAELNPSVSSEGEQPTPPPPETVPTFLGRYRVLARIGDGGFGVVYRGRDEELRRDVAIKVPHRHRVASPEDAEAYLNEARVLASLDHPHIVPVYDTGRTADGLCYVVSKFIDGTDLRERLRAGRPSVAEAAALIATIAEALHHAHRQGLVHRDVKPANILLDTAGKPYLADFGMVLGGDFGRGASLAGTPVYMSPEQARGDSDRVDGRSDVFSLGVVFYEMLTGRRPFQARDLPETLALIAGSDPRPPRQIDDAIPPELERICLKALTRRIADRYTTARDLADDLRAWLGRTPAPAPAGTPTPTSVPGWLTMAVAGAILLSVLAGAIALAVLNRDPGGGRLPPVPPTAVRNEPTVKPLVWPRGRDVCKWEVLPETNQLKVYTDSVGLLQLGETGADAWEFSATLRQLAPTGRIGLFLGYRKDPRNATVVFELVKLVVAGDKAYLQRSIETYRPEAPGAGTTGTVHGTALLRGIRAQNKIRLSIRSNRLAEVYFNDEPVPELSDVELQSPAAGPFGVFNHQSDGVVSGLLFNDTPIPLLADPASRSKELP